MRSNSCWTRLSLPNCRVLLLHAPRLLVLVSCWANEQGIMGVAVVDAEVSSPRAQLSYASIAPRVSATLSARALRWQRMQCQGKLTSNLSIRDLKVISHDARSGAVAARRGYQAVPCLVARGSNLHPFLSGCRLWLLPCTCCARVRLFWRLQQTVNNFIAKLKKGQCSAAMLVSGSRKPMHPSEVISITAVAVRRSPLAAQSWTTVTRPRSVVAGGSFGRCLGGMGPTTSSPVPSC